MGGDQGAAERFNAHLDHPTATMTRHVVVRETYEEAEAIARRSWPVFEAHWFSTPVRVTEEGVPVAQEQQTYGEDFDAALARDLPAGPPHPCDGLRLGTAASRHVRRTQCGAD